MNILSRKVSLIYLLRTTCETILEFSILHPLRVFVFTLLTRKNNRDALVKTYFDHVYPFAPVINRVDFIRGYQSGDCSLFLLHVILTPASLHAPVDVLSACGFASRSAAQESFFYKAKLLHDFVAEDDLLLMLQGSIILSMVILDHPTDRDFGYWFHNAIRLATKLDLLNTCVSYSWTVAIVTCIAVTNCLRTLQQVCSRRQTSQSLKVVQKDLVGSLRTSLFSIPCSALPALCLL